MKTNKTIQLAEEIADLLIELEKRGVLSPEQSDIIATELDTLFYKILSPKNIK